MRVFCRGYAAQHVKVASVSKSASYDHLESLGLVQDFPGLCFQRKKYKILD